MSNSRSLSALGVSLIVTAALAPLVLLGACGGSVGNGVAGCVSGQQIACACIGGSQGVQRCDDVGCYGACECGGIDFPTPSASSSASSGYPPPGDPPSSAPPPPSSLPTPVGTGQVDDVSGCSGAANVMVFDGDSGDYIHPGYERITGAYWTANPSAAHDDISFDIEPGPGQKFSWWNPEVHSPQMSGALVVGVYPNASRAAFTSPIQAGIDISGDGRGCNTISGTFWIHEIAWNGDALAHVLLAFEQHCEDGPAALRGCIAYTAAPTADAGP